MTELEHAFRKIQGDLETTRGKIFILELVVSVLLKSEPETRRAEVDFVLRKLLANMREIPSDAHDPFILGMEASVDSIISRIDAPRTSIPG